MGFFVLVQSIYFYLWYYYIAESQKTVGEVSAVLFRMTGGFSVTFDAWHSSSPLILCHVSFAHNQRVRKWPYKTERAKLQKRLYEPRLCFFCPVILWIEGVYVCILYMYIYSPLTLWTLLILQVQVLYRRPESLRVLWSIFAVFRTAFFWTDISDVVPGIWEPFPQFRR